MTFRHQRSRFGCTLALCVVLSAVLPSSAADALVPSNFKSHAAKILGAENCAECHAPMEEAWKRSVHYTGFNDRHRTENAREIADKMGVRRMKSGSLCINCHYTNREVDGALSAISGVSCESCHNAGADWNDVHSHRRDPDSLTAAAALGMIRPSNFYQIGARCFGCHTVPEEKLVNVGGHRAGSALELLAWSQGEVRHNLVASSGKVNEPAPIEERRMFYIVGRMLDLEFGLRGLAKATVDGDYSRAMVERVKSACGALEALQEVAPQETVARIIDLAASAPLEVGRAADLLTAAGKISDIARAYSAAGSGAAISAIDPMLPELSKFKGTVYAP